jgi:hypothetical protein
VFKVIKATLFCGRKRELLNSQPFVENPSFSLFPLLTVSLRTEEPFQHKVKITSIRETTPENVSNRPACIVAELAEAEDHRF